jgi:endonuclease YncB( thermonuclease family)
VKRTPPRRKHAGRRVLIVFLAGVAIATYAILWLSMHNPTMARLRRGDIIPLMTCLDIVDGRTLLVECKGATNTVHLGGVRLPSACRDILPPGVDFEKEDEIARKVLLVWVFKKFVNVTPDSGLPMLGGPREFEGQVTIFGVDIARKLIAEGQAAVAEDANPRRESYKSFETVARDARKGMWRHLSPDTTHTGAHP